MKKTDGTYIKIEDRKEAIRYAIVNGQPGDIIVLAGKGHEDYQEIEGVKYPMDERVLIREIMKEEHIISYFCFLTFGRERLFPKKAGWYILQVHGWLFYPNIFA